MTDSGQHTEPGAVVRGLMQSWLRWGLLLVGVLALGTWGVGRWQVARAPEKRAEAVAAGRQAAYEAIQQELDAVFADLSARGRAMARHPDVVAGLRDLAAGQPEGRARLVRWAASQTPETRNFVEVYDPTPSLQAWNGPGFPMDSAVRTDRFLLQEQESLVRDGDKRTALVVWIPVRDGRTILGAVRLGTMVEERMPVRNEYLRDYSWDEEWTRRLGQPVSFAFNGQTAREKEGRYVLRSPSDGLLGTVDISEPDEAAWVETIRSGYRDVLVFWAFLASLMILAAASTLLWRAAPDRPAAALTLLGYGLFVALTRWEWLAADIPARWQTGKAPLAPLFDPQHLASIVGGGVMRTIGDLMISALLLTLITVIVLRSTAAMRKRVRSDVRFRAGRFSRRLLLLLGMQQGLIWIGSILLFEATHHAVLDSTLAYFERSGLLPGRLVLVVFASLLLMVFALVLLLARLAWMMADRLRVTREDLPPGLLVSGAVVLFFLPVAWINTLFGPEGGVPMVVLAVITVSTWAAALLGPTQPADQGPLVALRRIVPLVILTSLILFPMMELSAADKIRLRMVEAAESYLEDRDARATFAISEVLDAVDTPAFASSWTTLVSGEPQLDRVSLDSLAESLTSGFMLSALSRYDVTVTLFSEEGEVRGRYSNLARRLPRALRDAEDETEYALFRAMYREFGDSGPMVEKLTGSTDQNRFRFAGFRSLAAGGFVLVRAEQRVLAETAGTPFPKVLAPAGYYGDRYADLSIAEYRNGVLMQTEGPQYGRSLLDPSVAELLRAQPELWRTESVRERSFLTYYRVHDSVQLDAEQQVTAVRRSSSNIFDQLYHLLRIIVAGLLLCLPLYGFGVLFRWRRTAGGRGVRHFRDRVLNAFFSVGLITVVAMGVVGLRVVTGENERAIESWLRQHLDRVEETLELEARGEELPYRVMDRISVDSLAARVGVDLVVYNNLEVEQASRSELIRDRLIERRLPVHAYEALYFDGFPFVTVDQRLGLFDYTAGYRALTDEQGAPRYVVAIPTLPEQERIEEERARTVAYLFGALLLLVLVVMVTASLLANALTRPIARLRAGLQAVAAGHFERIAPIDSGDEIAELVDSFNTMQDQLEESRSLLAQQERQLAWREMARQVAHEIKNPLTPMKLSIQHLRSAFTRRAEDGSDDERFATKFSQTTGTLIEQIDALARIANEFSSFGRMPTHIREEVDLNLVVTEAVGLMEAEENVTITTELADEALMVNGDREALRRVYINFLKNAIQAVPDDREAVIRVRTRKEEDGNGRSRAVGEVTDNGSGIPRNLWDKIFVPSFSTKTSGTGLGLAIARKTVESMDGEIGFETGTGQGSTFWIRVPLSGLAPMPAAPEPSPDAPRAE
jgi:two-component system nitrogen regulation sensor histidine kinase NtrY